MTAVIGEADQQRALDRAVNRLRDEDPTRSASVSVVGWQRAVLWVLLTITIGFAILDPLQTAIVLIGLSTLKLR